MAVPILALAFALVAALVLNLWLRTSWSLPFKLGAVLLTSALYVGTYYGLREMQGWPITDPLPDRFRLHWAMVEEPDKAADQDGWIYVWLRPLDGTGEPYGKPRAHQIPFNAETAGQVQAALDSIEDGKPMDGYLSRGSITPSEEEQAPVEGVPTGTAPADEPEEGLRIEFREAPSPSLPMKEPIS